MHYSSLCGTNFKYTPGVNMQLTCILTPACFREFSPCINGTYLHFCPLRKKQHFHKTLHLPFFLSNICFLQYCVEALISLYFRKKGADIYYKVCKHTCTIQ